MYLKDSIVKNLCQLFRNISEVQINERNGSMKDWIKEAPNKSYWTELIDNVIDPTKPPPPRLSE